MNKSIYLLIVTSMLFFSCKSDDSNQDDQKENVVESENSSEMDEQGEYAGYIVEHYDVPLVDEYGDPLIDTLPDGTMSYVYPEPDTAWITKDGDTLWGE